MKNAENYLNTEKKSLHINMQQFLTFEVLVDRKNKLSISCLFHFLQFSTLMCTQVMFVNNCGLLVVLK